MLQERKRSHSPDREKGLYRPSKAFRNDTSILIPPFPLPNMGYGVQYRQGATPRGQTPQTVSQSGAAPTSTKLLQSNVGSKVSPTQNNVIWPYYPQKATGNAVVFFLVNFLKFIKLFNSSWAANSGPWTFFMYKVKILQILYTFCSSVRLFIGAQFYPQVMGGFYQDPSGIPSTLSLNVTSTIPQTANTCHTTMSGASRHNLQVTPFLLADFFTFTAFFFPITQITHPLPSFFGLILSI